MLPNSPPSKLAIFAWCLYDWAISPFSVLITTFIFATYFTQKVAVNPIVGTAQWGEANAAAGLIAALLSPALGAIADREGRRKPWLFFFTAILLLTTAMLWYVQPHSGYLLFALSAIIVATFSIEVSMVFYNAMLNTLAPPHFLGRLSGWGWASGYLGGLCALILALFIFITRGASWLGLNEAASENIRICAPFVAFWILLFSWPIFAFTPDRPSTRLGLVRATRDGLTALKNTLYLLHREHKNILIFLIARMLYIDGLITIFAFGGIYAAGVFGMTLSEVIQFGIAMNLSAGIGAALFGFLDDARGPKITILLTLSLMIIFGVGILWVHSKTWFWVLGMGLSLGVGPVQSASRSLLIRIAPSALITELFGLYTLSGRATSFMGPWILGVTTELFRSQRAGMSTVFFFLIAGGILLTQVRLKREFDWPDK